MAKQDDADKKAVATNRRAYFEYFVDDKIEAGIELQGPEVKSVRARHVNLAEAYAEIRGNEVWVHGMTISPYPAAREQPDPRRSRRLLLNKAEIRRLERQVRQKGYTLIPLKVYFSASGYAKVQLGLCRGKRQYDKREAIAERDDARNRQRQIREFNR